MKEPENNPHDSVLPGPQKSRAMEMTMRRGSLSDDQDAEYVRYYRSRPIHERVEAMERLREAYYGKDYAATCRLSRSDLRIQRRSR